MKKNIADSKEFKEELRALLNKYNYRLISNSYEYAEVVVVHGDGYQVINKDDALDRVMMEDEWNAYEQ